MRLRIFLAELRRYRPTPLGIGLLLAGVGFLVWTGLSVWAGLGGEDDAFHLREAWTAEAYFLLGMPLMCAAVAAAAFALPEQAWRWPLWLVAGHQAGIMSAGLGMQSGVSLFILTLALAVLLATLFAIPALVGSLMARRLA